MVSVRIGIGIGALIALAGLAAAPVAALTLKECSVAYKSAKRSGTLGSMSWRQFRKTQCAPKAAPAAGPAPGGSGYLPRSRAVFPTAIAPKYSDEIPARARRQTCLDQYRLNKVHNANGGLKWVEKDGGYYSECREHLRKAHRKR